MTRRPRISALIIARDEAKMLPGCLATLGWADEVVVVVDAESRDETAAIARRKADRTVVRRFDDFAAQRNAALAAATGDWVFAIDADERVTPSLASEIREAVADPRSRLAGYRVPIRSMILGRQFVASGTQDDRPLRLFRRRLGRWTGAVHETVALRGAAGELSRPLLHRTIPTMGVFLRKLNKYTTLEAVDLVRRNRPARRGDLAIRPLWTFARLYLGKKGFRDGPEGFVFCALSAVSVAVRGWKHRELLQLRRTQIARAEVPQRRAA